jgi:hypothetical protein
MGVPFEEASDNLEDVAKELFDIDFRVRSVGIVRHENTYGFRAVRNSAVPVSESGNISNIHCLSGVPVSVTDALGEVESLVMLSGIGPSSPISTGSIPETDRHRPLVSGLQVQNFDDDNRQEELDQGFIFIGTLGCFVRLANGRSALLSNNHIIAAENRGLRDNDRVFQPGNTIATPADHIAILTDFVDLRVSPMGATLRKGNVVYNEVDAGVAEIVKDVEWAQGYLPSRRLVPPSGIANTQVGDEVFKVGCTTGLTYGEVTDVSTIVGPVNYHSGSVWFRRSFIIEGLNGTKFSDSGDSGSAIVRTDGKIVGILYAGNGQQNYACPIDVILGNLNCTLA